MALFSFKSPSPIVEWEPFQALCWDHSPHFGIVLNFDWSLRINVRWIPCLKTTVLSFHHSSSSDFLPCFCLCVYRFSHCCVLCGGQRTTSGFCHFPPACVCVCCVCAWVCEFECLCMEKNTECHLPSLSALLPWDREHSAFQLCSLASAVLGFTCLCPGS